METSRTESTTRTQEKGKRSRDKVSGGIVKRDVGDWAEAVSDWLVLLDLVQGSRVSQRGRCDQADAVPTHLQYVR